MTLLRSTPHRVLGRLAGNADTFTVLHRGESESDEGLIQTDSAAASGTVSGLLVSTTPEERQRYAQEQTLVRRALIVEGTPAVGAGDRLVRASDSRVFYVAEVVGEVDWTRIVLEDRADAQA